MHLGFTLLSIAIYWSLVAGLLLLARRGWRRRRIARFVPLALGAWLTSAAFVPAVASPLLIVAFVTGGFFDPQATYYAASTARSLLENQSLLNARDLRRATVTVPIEIDGRRVTGSVDVRCVERRITDRDYMEVLVFHIEVAVAGELDISIADGVSAHVVPPNWLCRTLERLPLGAQENDLVDTYGRSAGTWNVIVVDERGARPLIRTFNITDGPLTIAGVTVLQPLVVDVNDDASITPAELARYAPPYRTVRDRGPERPAILANYRPSFRHGPQPIADYLTESGWCNTPERRDRGNGCLPAEMITPQP